MTRLINIDNGGTLTDFCLADGGEVRLGVTGPGLAPTDMLW
jgi:hypothetical protein